MLIPTLQNTKTITDLRENTLGLIDEVDKQGHIYIFNRSTPKAVMMSLNEFMKLQEILEFYMDEKEAQILSQEPRGKGVPIQDLIKKYSKK